MKKNDEIILKIDGTSHDGYGVGRYDNMAVFVPLAAEGDEIRAKIVKLKKTYAYGKLLEIITQSEHRVKPDCDVFARCGGCVFRHISYDKECEIKTAKVENNIRKIGGYDMAAQPIIKAKKTCRYRNKAQYPVTDSGNTGFFAVHSHRIIETDDCLLQPEIFTVICKKVSNWIKQNGISVYSEATHKGLIRHIYLRQAQKTNEIMLTLVINGDTLPCAEQLIDAIKNDVQSIQININKKDTNVILGDICKTVYGQDHITDILCGVKVRLSPLSFYQVNRDMAEKLYEKAAEYADCDNKTVLDLYCGAGTIGLSMAKKAKKIIGVEIIPDAVKDAEFNAKINDIQNAEFICGDATDAAEKLNEKGIKPDVVILDPPRKGCTKELLSTVANGFAPKKIVYVSCDCATLARDAAILRDYGYILKEYTPVDLFSSTSHIETVALLSRQKVTEHIYIDVNIADLPKTTRTTATYPEIKAYIKDKYGLCVSSLNIAQIKEKHGFEKMENYNKGKDGHRVPKCPPEKEKAIEDAFKHFGML